MTYKELVDRIENAVTRHKMLVDFGYGQLSDIKVLDNSEDGADYPYAFLLPTGIARQNQSVIYSFSLIVMEMVSTPRETLTVQSNCIQYINDLIADLRFDTTFDGDVNLTQSIQVFRERFQDEVAGATLNLQVTLADAINDCDTPFEELIETVTAVARDRDYNSLSSGSRSIFVWPVPEAPATYTMKFNISLRLNEALTGDASPWNVPYITVIQDQDTPRFLADIPFDGSASMVGELQTIEFTRVFTLEDVAPDGNDIFVSFGHSGGAGVYPDGTPMTLYPDAIDLVSGELQIYK